MEFRHENLLYYRYTHSNTLKLLANGPNTEDLTNCNEDISKLVDLFPLLLPAHVTVLTKLWKILVSKKETKLAAACTGLYQIKSISSLVKWA